MYKHTQGLAFEVIVSDNGSSDGSIEMIKDEFPQVVLIENNLGFGAANNRGLAVAKGKYIFYLNSDTFMFFTNIVMSFFELFHISPAFFAKGIHRTEFYTGEVEVPRLPPMRLMN